MKYNVFMRKARILLILGTWVTILPFLGFPNSWKDILFSLTGLGLMIFSYVLYRNYKKEEKETKQNKTFDNFRENSDFDVKPLNE
jgi:amino acid permease